MGGGGCNVCPFREKAFTLPTYPPLDPDNLPGQAQHGVLGQLDGTWINAPGTFGIHTTMVPAPGSTSEQMLAAFHFITQEYTETLKFEKKDDPVRNRLGSNEQFVGRVNYESDIKDRNDMPIHNEVGMYLWLGVWTHNGAAPYNKGVPCLYSRKATEADVENDFSFPTLAAGAQGPQFIPPVSISRQGSIPHGNAIQLFGSQPSTKNVKHPTAAKDIPGPPEIYDQSNGMWDAGSVAFHKSMGYTAKKLNAATCDARHPHGARKKPEFAHEKVFHGLPNADGTYPHGQMDPNSGEAYMFRIFNGAQKLTQPDGTVVERPLFPYCVQPNFKLVDANEELDIISHDMFTLNTARPQGIQGGSLNGPGTERYCMVHDMKVTMWISKIRDKATGKIYDQLQYEQVIHFQFGFGTDGTQTLWPHIQCNTLRRASDLCDEVAVEVPKGKRPRRS